MPALAWRRATHEETCMHRARVGFAAIVFCTACSAALLAPAHVLLARAGRSVLTLDLVVPLAASAGTESIVLPASASPISRVALTLPKNGVDLSAAGGFIAEHAETAGESRWTAYGRPNQPLTLSWKRKIDDRRAELPVRVRARLTTLVGLTDDVHQV